MRGKRVAFAVVLGLSIALVAPFAGLAAAVTFSAAGPDPASIQGTVDAFRAALGTLNPNVAGTFGTGRREINWDGVPDQFAAPNNMPANFFNVNSPRGAVFTTGGTGFQVSANAVNPTATPVEFGNLNAVYPGSFQTFSPQRLFTALGSNILDVNFFIPGSGVPASVSGFGAVFTDVDLPMSTSLEFFDPNGVSLGIFFAPPANNGLSFVGVIFNAGERIARVRITSGNAALGAAVDDMVTDVVAMDDFIYAEPIVLPTTIGGGTFTCLQDDSSRAFLFIDPATGAFQFTSCTGLTFTGTGTVITKGCTLSLSANLPTLRVTAIVDTCVGRGSAGVQSLSTGRVFTIIDRNTTNNTCSCLP